MLFNTLLRLNNAEQNCLTTKKNTAGIKMFHPGKMQSKTAKHNIAATSSCCSQRKVGEKCKNCSFLMIFPSKF